MHAKCTQPGSSCISHGARSTAASQVRQGNDSGMSEDHSFDWGDNIPDYSDEQEPAPLIDRAGAGLKIDDDLYAAERALQNLVYGAWLFAEAMSRPERG